MKHNKPFSFFGSLGYQVIGIDSRNDVYVGNVYHLMKMIKRLTAS